MNFHDHPKYREMESEHLYALTLEGRTYRSAIESAASLLHKHFLGEIELPKNTQAEIFDILRDSIQKHQRFFDNLAEERRNLAKTLENDVVIGASSSYEEALDFLLESPTPEQIIEFRPSERLQSRMSTLLRANRSGTIAPTEQAELDEFMKIEHLMRMLKARAHLKLSKP